MIQWLLIVLAGVAIGELIALRRSVDKARESFNRATQMIEGLNENISRSNRTAEGIGESLRVDMSRTRSQPTSSLIELVVEELYWIRTALERKDKDTWTAPSSQR